MRAARSTTSASARLRLMPGDPLAFVTVSLAVIVTPGQDTALTIRNTLSGGRRGGVFTALGVVSGQLTWTLATCAGLAALLLASEKALRALKLAGAAYLVYLGGQSLLEAIRGHPRPSGRDDRRPRRVSTATAYRQGLVSNLGNVKIALFFTSLLPQFISADQASAWQLFPLGGALASKTLAWLTAYAFVLAKARDLLRRDRVRRALDAAMGAVLVAFGARVAAS